MLNAAAVVLALVTAAADLSVVSGRVLDGRGRPIGGAQVFLEQGISGQLQVTQSAPDGSYHFDNLLPGFTGVFARSPGYAFGGRSVRIAIADTLDGVDLTLREAGTLSGTVRTPSGQLLSGVRVTRVVLLGDTKVGIPYAKLARYGVAQTRTDDRGRFSIDSLPRGEPVALKIVHSEYAQEGATGLKVGDRNVKITLSRGVLITGSVLARGSDTAVPNATIYFRNANPPNDTVVLRGGLDGSFSFRLKPGAYSYNASGATYRSPSLQRLVVTGQYQTQHVTLRVAATATIKGQVKDAVSGKPVQDARLLLESFGIPSAKTRTGPTGDFEFPAAEGEVVVRLELAPGYLNPPEPAFRIQVSSNRAAEVPTFWVVPIPKYSLEVVDEDNQPVKGAVIRVLRPATFGWRTTDDNGYVDLNFASIPPDGTVVGFAEHPQKNYGAVFAITRDRAKDAIVQLRPLATVRGTVQSHSGVGLTGVAVESRFTGEAFSDTLVLWRTLTARGGAFQWAGVPQSLPQWCVAATEDKDGQMLVSSPLAFTATDLLQLDLGAISIADARSGKSALGRNLKWFDNDLLCGELSSSKSNPGPAVVVYVSSEQAALAAEGLDEAKRILDRPGLAFALVVDGAIPCPGVSFPILNGKAPAAASTYLLDARGAVVLECFGLPPVFGINEIAPQEP